MMPQDEVIKPPISLMHAAALGAIMGGRHDKVPVQTGGKFEFRNRRIMRAKAKAAKAARKAQRRNR